MQDRRCPLEAVALAPDLVLSFREAQRPALGDSYRAATGLTPTAPHKEEQEVLEHHCKLSFLGARA